ncbi:hypothetical protein MRS44_002013 [Fusarium solani]|uniref:uncharacterized protein n=1 Tax=Fusarium solani TaxID=169388 RepID=UPI0032C479C4|nr:hypothetical protein MRS44_002013 [Fusarium solani]
MGLKRSFALLVDDSAPVNLSAVGGRRQGSAGDNGANDSKPQLEVKRSISEDLSIEDERRRKRLCCLISRIEIGGPKNSEWNIATAGAEVQTKMEPEVKIAHSLCPSQAPLPSNLWQNFRGQHGKAYLFQKAVNIEIGTPQERSMTTGRHIMSDVKCRRCKETVGWRYDKAFEPSEKYKEGKIVLEAELLCVV